MRRRGTLSWWARCDATTGVHCSALRPASGQVAKATAAPTHDESEQRPDGAAEGTQQQHAGDKTARRRRQAARPPAGHETAAAAWTELVAGRFLSHRSSSIRASADSPTADDSVIGAVAVGGARDPGPGHLQMPPRPPCRRCHSWRGGRERGHRAATTPGRARRPAPPRARRVGR